MYKFTHSKDIFNIKLKAMKFMVSIKQQKPSPFFQHSCKLCTYLFQRVYFSLLTLTLKFPCTFFSSTFLIEECLLIDLNKGLEFRHLLAFLRNLKLFFMLLVMSFKEARGRYV